MNFNRAHGEKYVPILQQQNTGSQINYPECSNIFSANVIHNANEIGLFNCSLPEGALVQKKAKFGVFGKNKDTNQVTELCCTNMSGSDRKKVFRDWQIGKGAVGFFLLFVTCCSTRNARRTSIMFAD